MSEKIEAYQRLIEGKTGSKTFCPLPWIHIATRPNGDARLCCGSNASGADTGDYTVGLVKNQDGKPANFNRDLPVDALNNGYMRDVRLTMIEGKIPDSCAKCFEEEANGVISKRLWETYHWTNNKLDIAQLIRDTATDGTIPPKIRYLDLRLGHTCNLKCVMCTPHDSSRWVEDYDTLMDTLESPLIRSQISWDRESFNNNWYKNEGFWNQVYEQIPNIRELYFAGGEPLMIKEHKRFLLEIIKRGYNEQISLRYNTNGIFVTDEMINIWSKFKKVKVAFSIDAVGEKNWYIRYPTNWDDVVRNLRKLDATPDNIEIGIQAAVQIFNIKHLPEFARWKLDMGFKKINDYKVGDHQSGGGLINMHLLYLPTFLSARVLSEKDKQDVGDRFSEFKDWLWNNYRQDDDFWKHNPYGWTRWEAILRFVQSGDQSSQVADFKEYISSLDKIRKTDAKSIFPELCNLF
jgi:organic radical activating enzyme